MKYFFISLLFTALQAHASQISQIADRGTLGNIGFDHLAMNDSGEFVAVSRTKVFVGKTDSDALPIIHVDDTKSWVLTGRDFQNVGDERITTYLEIKGTRLAINNSGWFILASNRTIWLGNTRTKSFSQIHENERFTEIQSVLLNDAGHFLIHSSKIVMTGNVSTPQVNTIIPDMPGSMGQYSLWTSMNGTVNASTGDVHAALNQAGQFIVASSRAIFGGSVAQSSVELLKSQDNLYTQQVSISEQGHFIVLGDGGVYRGIID